MKIIISGGCGFIGSNLAIKLKNDNPSFQIVCLDNLKRRGSELNVPRLIEHQIDFVHGDMRYAEDLDQVNGGDLFIDASAEPSVLAGISGGQKSLIDNNFTSTVNALEWCVKHQSKILFLSTSRVYPIHHLESASYDEEEKRFNWSNNQTIPGISKEGVSEIFPMDGARSLYGATKYASELIIQEYAEFNNIDYIINRCGVISGPWQMGKIDQGVVVLWIARHLNNKNLKYIGYNGLGKQVRDALHIEDLYQLLKKQLTYWDDNSKEIYNVGGGLRNSFSLLELTQLCEKHVGHSIKIDREPEQRQADLRLYITDNTKVSEAFGWEPKKSNDDLIKETTEWILEYKDQLKHILA